MDFAELQKLDLARWPIAADLSALETEAAKFKDLKKRCLEAEKCHKHLLDIDVNFFEAEAKKRNLLQEAETSLKQARMVLGENHVETRELQKFVDRLKLVWRHGETRDVKGLLEEIKSFQQRNTDPQIFSLNELTRLIQEADREAKNWLKRTLDN